MCVHAIHFAVIAIALPIETACLLWIEKDSDAEGDHSGLTTLMTSRDLYHSIASWLPLLPKAESDESKPKMECPITTSSVLMGNKTFVLHAVVIGCLCGSFAAAYHYILNALIEFIWHFVGPTFVEGFGLQSSPWIYIIVICPLLGMTMGAVMTAYGEPSANLPGVVQEIHKHGSLKAWPEIPLMSAVSIICVSGGASLGPEAPLVAIGGGIASAYAKLLNLGNLEVLLLSICGMGAGLAAFFGVSLGGGLFACEVLHRYGIEYYEALVPALAAGLSSHNLFRLLSCQPQRRIWSFIDDVEVEFNEISPWYVVLTSGLPAGVLGGVLGVLWMKGTKAIKRGIKPWDKCHITKGAIGGLLIGIIGAFIPLTLFWSEHEIESLVAGIDLPHAWPEKGILGIHMRPWHDGLEWHQRAYTLGVIAGAKLLAISFTVVAGYRGGFIFPFFFAGMAAGGSLAEVIGTSIYASALSGAAGVNVACTRCVISTPLVLAALSGRPDLFPCLLAASVIALHVSSSESIIVAAGPRKTPAEIAKYGVEEESYPSKMVSAAKNKKQQGDILL